MIPKHELAAFRELTATATPGPWTVNSRGEIKAPSLKEYDSVVAPDGPEVEGLAFHTDTDKDFILQARTMVPRLLEELESLLRREKSAWKLEIEFQDDYFRGWREWKASFLSTALDGESGEFTHEAFPTEFAILHLRLHVARGKAANLVKKLEGGGTNRNGKYTPRVVIEELADVFIYLVLLAEVLGYDEYKFRNVVQEKVQKNMKRMAPGEWV
jgi:hypothetical protein